MTQDTSLGSGATPPEPSTPVTGTPAPATGVTPEQKPPTPTLTLEDALKKLADLEHSHANSTEELARHRKKLSTYEKAEKEAQDAALSEVEKSNKRAAEAEQRIKQYQQQLVAAQVKLAAQSKGIIDPDLAALAIANELEYGEDGMPTNLEKALEKLIKNKPYLLAAQKPADPPATPAQIPPTTGKPAIPAMNPGRSNIAGPSPTTSGKPIRLSSPGVFVAPGTPSKYQP